MPLRPNEPLGVLFNAFLNRADVVVTVRFMHNILSAQVQYQVVTALSRANTLSEARIGLKAMR